MWTTLDCYTLQLSDRARAAIATRPRESGLWDLIRNNHHGSLRLAIDRSIGQLARHAYRTGSLRSRDGSTYLVFTADSGGRTYRMIARPLSASLAEIVAIQPQQSEADYKIGDPARPANDGRNPNYHHNRVIAAMRSQVKKDQWGDIRRELPQVAGGAESPVQATERHPITQEGLNVPDLSGVDLRSLRAHIEVDTSPEASRAHQSAIFAADRNTALGDNARKARGVFVVIDPNSGYVTSVRHVSHGKTNRPRVVTTNYGAAGVPIQTLLAQGVLDRPVSQPGRLARSPGPARRRPGPQREFELEAALLQLEGPAFW